MWVECTINHLDRNGFGKCKEHKSIRIQNAIPGETVRAVKLHGDLFLAKKVIRESKHRVRPKCEHFNLCGGCRWQHMNYNYQLELKVDILRKLFNMEPTEVIPSPNIFSYRGKMEYTFGGEKTDIKLGFNVIGRFDAVVNINKCEIQPKEFNRIINEVREFVNSKEFEPYNKITHKGFLRYLILRKGFFTNQILLNIITTSSDRFPLTDLKDHLNIEIKSMSWAINDSFGDFARGEIRSIIGEPHIEEKINNKVFLIGPYTFFQANPSLAGKMVDIVKSEAEEGETAIDIYSGIGLFAIHLADKFENVIAIESERDSIELGLKSAAKNKIGNIRFVEGFAEKILPKEIKNYDKIDVIVVDPPRAGLHRNVIRSIIRSRTKKIIYVSCNPHTAKRDIGYLKAAGYSIEYIALIDQFPHTPHMEIISKLER